MTEVGSMKDRMRGAIALALAVLVAGCGASDAGSDSASSSRPEAEDAAVLAERAREVGEEAALALASELFGRLNAEIEAQGHVGAVGFCSAEALPATGRVAASLDGGLDIKRTSNRYRNPANAPDEQEAEMLAYFEREHSLDTDPPDYVVQRASSRAYRYYKPLVIVPPCLACHGDPESMEPELRTTLEALYPDDLATGYEAGDFRGLIRVSIPIEALQHTD